MSPPQSAPAVLRERPGIETPVHAVAVLPEPVTPARHRRRVDLGAPGVVVAGVTVLVAASFALRAPGLGVWYWIDEALTVGLASHPPAEIPGLLRLDGSPPLYYLLLRGWMAVFGAGEVATHSLSLLFALATVPVGFWAGRTLFDRRTGWVVASLAAAVPFLNHFATETRMYSLVTLLSLVVATTFVQSFVHRQPRWAAWFAAALAALLYTHTWGLYVAVAAALALVPLVLVSGDRRAVLRLASWSFGAVALAYAPWSLVLVEQAGSTGAPWAFTPSPRGLLRELAAIVRDERVLGVLTVVAGGALVPLLRRPRTPAGGSAWALTTFVAVPIVLGWAVAHVEPSWATRYLAVVVGPLLLVAGWGLARAGTAGVLALVLSCVLWVQPFTRLEGGLATEAAGKSDARALAAEMDGVLRPGDVVIVAQPEAVPLFATYLSTEVRWATAWGAVADPLVMDWRDALERLRATTAASDLQPILDGLPRGDRIALVGPGAGLGPTDTEWIRLFHLRNEAWRRALTADDRFERTAVLRPDAEGRAAVPFITYLYERRR